MEAPCLLTSLPASAYSLGHGYSHSQPHHQHQVCCYVMGRVQTLQSQQDPETVVHVRMAGPLQRHTACVGEVGRS